MHCLCVNRLFLLRQRDLYQSCHSIFHHLTGIGNTWGRRSSKWTLRKTPPEPALTENAFSLVLQLTNLQHRSLEGENRRAYSRCNTNHGWRAIFDTSELRNPFTDFTENRVEELYSECFSANQTWFRYNNVDAVSNTETDAVCWSFLASFMRFIHIMRRAFTFT